MLRNTVTTNTSARFSVHRGAGVTLTKSKHHTMYERDEWVPALLATLATCMEAEQRAQMTLPPPPQRPSGKATAAVDNDNDAAVSTAATLPSALKSIEFCIRMTGQSANAPIIGPLTTTYAALARSLQVLTIADSDFDESTELGTLAALATQLKTLTLRGWAPVSVQGLQGHCEYLQKVDLLCCKQLTSLAGLEGHVWLEVVIASHTPITSVEPLRLCPALTTVQLENCQELTSLDGLEEHQYLQEVNAACTAITSVDPLRSCPALKRVYVFLCEGLPSTVLLQTGVVVCR